MRSHAANARTKRTAITAFTLIELLIVVAIIAILAAIAVPNFLEAQARAKISRCEADMKSLETALESYAIDHAKYPEVFNPFRLTTPIAYITTIPEDPFAPILSTDVGYPAVVANYGSPVKKYYIYHGPPTFDSHPGMIAHGIKWTITGLGPDRGWFDSSTGEDKYPRYDATNGTRSRGNITRVGPGNLPEMLYRSLWDGW